MKEFCEHCAALESELEILRSKHHKETECMKERIRSLREHNNKLKNENDSLSLDIGFYNKDFNLTSN